MEFAKWMFAAGASLFALVGTLAGLAFKRPVRRLGFKRQCPLFPK